MPWIPRKTDLRGEVQIRLAHPVSQPGAPLIEQISAASGITRFQEGFCYRRARDRSQIAIRTSGVANVAQSIVQSQVRPDFPRVSNIRLKTGIEEPAGRVAEGRQIRAEALSIADVGSGEGVLADIGAEPTKPTRLQE